MKITFIKTPKPRRFRHVNIYYNPEEEERKERDVRVNKELGIVDENEPYKPTITRGSFRRIRKISGDENEKMDKSNLISERRAANIRFVIIACVLIAIAFVLYISSGDFLAL
ncbi:MAG: hypothetical protein R3Y59_01030 [bacterium]